MFCYHQYVVGIWIDNCVLDLIGRGHRLERGYEFADERFVVGPAVLHSEFVQRFGIGQHHLFIDACLKQIHPR